MKRTTSMTIAAVVVASIAAGAFAPAFAQDGQRQHGSNHEMQKRGHSHDESSRDHRGGNKGMRNGGGQRGGLISVVCSPNGTDRLEHMLVKLSQRVSPTADQQPLYDELKSTALTAQTKFADTCAAARPDTTAADAAKPDMAERLKTRLAIEQARVEAMTAVVPAFEAFFNSLTDEQKQLLAPGGRHMQDGGMKKGRHNHDQRGQNNMGQPNQS